MFFFTYLARELRRRLRQAVFIALGLAIGVGLVLTVTAAAAGVKNAQAGVLQGLYGVGTDITVTGAAPSPPKGGQGPGSGKGTQITMGPNGAQICTDGKCHALKNGYTIDNLASASYSPVSAASVGKVAALQGVTAAAGGLLLTDTCSAISQAVPTGTKVVALDSAKQTHYLPAFMGIEAWFGTTKDCVDAALTGRWRGSLA